MALPHLIKYVYTNGTDEVIRRGKKIHAIGYVELIEYDELFETVTFRIKDDSYSTYYKVFVQKFRDAKSLSVRCSCPYNLGDICRHEAAALIQLQELLHYFLVGAFHFMNGPHKDSARFMQKNDAVGQLLGQAHIMRHYDAGELELVL